MAGDVGCIQQPIVTCPIVREEKMGLSEVEAIKLSKPANNVTGVVRRDSTFVDLMESILNLFIESDNEYEDKFLATSIVIIVKDKMGSDTSTGMKDQPY